MKKPPVGAGGSGFMSDVPEVYPRYVQPGQRSTSAVSALIYRSSQAGWRKRCWIEAATQCDRWGDAYGALMVLREARRASR